MTWLWIANWAVALIGSLIWWRVARRWQRIARRWKLNAEIWKKNAIYWRNAWEQDAPLRREQRERERQRG